MDTGRQHAKRKEERMDDKMKIAIVVIVVLVLGVPLLGKVMTEDQGAQSAPADTGKKAGKGVDKAAGKAAGAPAVNLQPPLLNAGNLANSKWQMTLQGFPVTVSLMPGGVLIAESPIIQQMTQQPSVQGTWSVSGPTLTVSASAMGQSIKESAQISGNTLLVQGKPVQRLQ
jgi:hypothetical protein